MTWFIFAVLSAFFASLASILEKKTLERIHAVDFSTVLAFAAALISFPTLFTASWEHVSLPVLGAIFLVSILAAAAFIQVTHGVRHLEISSSSPLFLTSPMITALLAFVLLGEKLTLLQIGGMFLLLLGTYVLETKHFFMAKEFFQNLWGDTYSRLIMLGLLMYGFTSLGDRIILAHWGVSPMIYIALAQLFIAMIFLVLTLVRHRSIVPSLTIIRNGWKGIFLIAFLTTAYRLMQAEATALAAVGLVVAVKRSSTLFTTIIGGELFHDHGILRKTIACIIMIIGVYAIALG
jgi:transporter family protein